MPASRLILHVDMDGFFAAVAQLDHPELRGRPLLIGHDSPRSVVTTASYEARKFGCHSAMPMVVAKRLCPQAIIVPPDGPRIRECSQAMFAVLDDFSPLVQPLSVDEAFLDMTGTELLFGDPLQIGRQIKHAIHDATGLIASVGIAPNKFLAKLASDLEKPDGLTHITTADLPHRIAPLPLSRMWGIGPAALARLEKFGLATFGDLQRLRVTDLEAVFGSVDNATHFHQLALGLDDRPVVPDRLAKSIGQEQTFERDLTSPDHVRTIMLAQAEQVGWRLRKHGFHARGVTVKIRFGDFQTITRSTTLPAPTDITEQIRDAAFALFDQWAERYWQPVRLIGVTAMRLTTDPVAQLDLFANPDNERQRRLDATMDQIMDRFGKKSIGRGGGPGAEE